MQIQISIISTKGVGFLSNLQPLICISDCYLGRKRVRIQYTMKTIVVLAKLQRSLIFHERVSYLLLPRHQTEGSSVWLPGLEVSQLRQEFLQMDESRCNASKHGSRGSEREQNQNSKAWFGYCKFRIFEVAVPRHRMCSVIDI